MLKLKNKKHMKKEKVKKEKANKVLDIVGRVIVQVGLVL